MSNQVSMNSAGTEAATDTRKPAVCMSWTDLLFLHWQVSVESVQRRLPPGVEVDTFDGDATTGNTWVGLVPFIMTDCTFAGFGFVPGLRNFYECNVRVYVRIGALSGVWFMSLDAASLFAVLGGRYKWGLNYIYSRFDVTHADATHDYVLRRRQGPWPAAATHIRWITKDPRPAATPGSLEHFLTERYWLFARHRGKLWAGRIHHEPWSLCDAEVELVDDTLVQAAGFDRVTNTTPHAMASHRIDVLGDPLVPVSDAINQYEGRP